ncbi:MAG: hypothetical protein ACE5K4_10960 [Candidatus Hydrothermarchaeota archaeon]
MAKKIKTSKPKESFEVVTSSETFLASLRAMKPLVNSVKLMFDKDGLRIKETNDGRYAVVNFFMRKSGFAEYKVPEKTVLKVRLDDFLTAMKRVYSGWGHLARLTVDGKGHLVVEQVNERNKKREVKKRFVLPLYSIDEKEIDGDEIDKVEKEFEKRIDVEIPISKKDFKTGLKDIETLLGTGRRSYGYDTGGEVKIIAEKDFLILTTFNQYQQVITQIPRYNTNPNKDLSVMAQNDFKVSAIYEWGSLTNMFDLGRNAFTDEFVLRIGNNNPLQLVLSNPDKITLKLTLANREVNDLEHQYIEPEREYPEDF